MTYSEIVPHPPHPLMVKSDRGQLQMETKQLPRAKKAIVWSSLMCSSNAKLSIWWQKKTERKRLEKKQQKQKAFLSSSICSGLIGAEWQQSCMPTIPLSFCQVLWKENEELGRSKWNKVSDGAERQWHKRELSSIVISHPIFRRLFFQSHFHCGDTTAPWRTRSLVEA